MVRIASLVLGLFFGTIYYINARTAQVAPEALAQALAQDMKPSILAEWHKRPELANATIERVSLSPEGGSSTEFKGEVDATIDGQKQQLPLEVSFDPNTKRMTWKILPQK